MSEPDVIIQASGTDPNRVSDRNGIPIAAPQEGPAWTVSMKQARSPQGNFQPRTNNRRVTIALVSLYDLENYAVRQLAAVLRREGYRAVEIYFKDWRNNDLPPMSETERRNLVGILRETGADVVGLSLRASAYLKVAAELTGYIKARLSIPVLWGGTHVILDPLSCLPPADMLAVGEGETTLLNLARALTDGDPIEDIQGLWLVRDGQLIKNAVPELLPDLDWVPFRDFTHPDKYQIHGHRVIREDPTIHDPLYLIMTSRGCPYNCAFCYNSVMAGQIYRGKGKYYRHRSVDSVMEELHLARSVCRNLKRIKFDDEIFNFNPDWVMEFCRRYKEEIGVPFECFTEPKLVREELFTAMRDAGLAIVYMGIQNTFRISEELYDREVPQVAIRRAVDLFHRLKLDARYQIIVDDPKSTGEDKRELFDYLWEFPRPFELYLFSLVIFPGTELARKLLAEGKISEDDLEGKNDKTFRQLRVDLKYPRPPEDLFWTSLLVLLTKNFLPRVWLKRLSRSGFFRKHPRLLAHFAQICNAMKIALVGFGMLFRGELTFMAFKRWANPRSWITQ